MKIINFLLDKFKIFLKNCLSFLFSFILKLSDISDFQSDLIRGGFSLNDSNHAVNQSPFILI
jgi:hypothetical protein